MGRPIIAILGLSCALLSATPVLAIDPFPGELPGVDIGGRLPGGFESSGALWHPGLERLLIVNDGGWIAAMDPDGDDIEMWRCPGDLEAITMIDPDDEDVVYIGVERPDGIRAYDLDEREVIGSWDLTAWMRGPDNRGLELVGAERIVPPEYVVYAAHVEHVAPSPAGCFFVGAKVSARGRIAGTSNCDGVVTPQRSIPIRRDNLGTGKLDFGAVNYHGEPERPAGQLGGIRDSGEVVTRFGLAASTGVAANARLGRRGSGTHVAERHKSYS